MKGLHNMEDISRFKMHKKLKTWHFDLNREDLDYEIAMHIDKPDAFWENSIEEIIAEDGSSLTNGFFLKNEIPANNANDQALKSLQNDVRDMNAPSDDNWFERRKITEGKMFWELTEFFDLDHLDMRLATQNPMDMTYRHIDHEHQQVISSKEGQTEFNNVEDCFKSRGEWTKYIIIVRDLLPGQVFYWGNSIVDVKRGDVIAWDYATPHWTVNFSNYVRHTINVTGKKR